MPVMKNFVVAALFSALTGQVFAKAKKYDERGNVINAESVASPAAEASAPALNSAPAATPAENAGSTPAPAVAGDAPKQREAESEADEEAEAQRKKKNPLTKVYLENAELYHRSNRVDKSLENLRKSQEAGEDSFSREAKLKSLLMRARRGEAGLETEAEAFDDALKLAALLAIADGYQMCAREQTKKNDCLRDAERIFAYVGELQPGSREGRLARLRLGLLLIETGRHEAALPHLTRTLLGEQGTLQGSELPLDRAYFMLGQLYERPWYHKDGHKAEVAYRQVLKFAGSPYHAAAKERLQWLTRFSTGSARP